MLWDVVSDAELFHYLSPDIQRSIYQLFVNNIGGFYEAERTKTHSLVDINKKYIMLILNHIKQTYPYQPSKITIHEEPPAKELITYEEIQNEKKSQFERELMMKQNEFNDAVSIKAPPAPTFADSRDGPIKDMDRILREMQAQRNYEIDQFTQTQTRTDHVDDWLTPKETSSKPVVDIPTSAPSSRFKHLNDLEPHKKSVSFDETIQVYDSVDTPSKEDSSLFAKLKKKTSDDESVVLHIEETTPSERRIVRLEQQVITLHEKLDTILQLLHHQTNR